MLRVFKLREWAVVAVMLGMWATTLWAQEGGGEATSTAPSINYFSKLFHTDSMLGNVVIWSLVLSSVALVAVIIQAVLQNRKSAFMPQDLVDQLQALINEKKYKDALALAAADPTPLGHMISAALKQASRGYDAMEDALFAEADHIGNDRVRGLIWMEIAGAAGPMLGLFGTVYGMIVAFTQMVAVGGQPKPAELAGGIATALVCTFWGLVVGIPGVIGAALFRVKVEGLNTGALFQALQLLAPFRPGGKPPAAPPAPAPAPPAARAAAPPPAAAEPAA